LLARRGHAVTLFEQTEHVGPVGAGILLQASGQRVLRSMNLLEAVIADAERIEELVAFSHRGRRISRLRFADAPHGHMAYGLHRGDLFAVLHEAVLASGVHLRLNCAIHGVGANGSELMDSTGQSVGAFDLIVAADGSRSRLRQACGVRAFVHAYGFAALWAVGHDDSVRNRLLQHTRHTHRLCGLLPMGRGRTSFFWGIRADDWPEMRRGSFEDWQREVIELTPLAEPLVKAFRSFDDLVFSTYRAVWLPRAVRGRVACIGDAAHASSPLLGHGINLAMVDALQLAEAVAGESSVQAALQRFNVRQRFRNGYYSLLSATLTPSFQGRSTLVGVARDLALPWMQRVLPVRRVMLRTLAGV
jgi:2-polyprenyl-6-methoxyphenol hydroxylase-like FAD-dependent oxidoreductase